ncbi:MAG: hypothetical protein ACOCP4_04955 [Candidatus Woesearchaeota archaeon]
MAKINVRQALNKAVESSDYETVEMLIDSVDDYNGLRYLQPNDYRMLKLLINKSGATLDLSGLDGYSIENQDNLLNILCTIINELEKLKK